MTRPNQKGIALIMTLILVLVMSVMAVSLMFMSQSETWSSLNYRLMSQSRDGAEAGINSAANYIVNTYTQPGGVGDPTTAYNTGVSPVQNPSTASNGHDVILTTLSSHTSNYPVSSVATAFNTSGVGKGSVTAGNLTINYNTEATLLSMHSGFTAFGTTTPQTVQTWKIVSDGSISSIRNAKVEVSATLERHITPTFNYAAFATNNGCDSLKFGGGGVTNSYDSSAYTSSGTLSISASDGNVGTNGNLDTAGKGTTINGDLFTPRLGTGTCTTSNVTAWTKTAGKINGSVVPLPQPITYPNPTIPPPGTIDVTLTGGACPVTPATPVPGCVATGNDIYLPPGNYHNISISGLTVLHFSKGLYNINTFTETGANTALYIDEAGCASPCGTPGFDQTPGSGPVILNVAGNDSSGNPVGAGTLVVTLTGNSVQNASLVPMNFQILYAGVGLIQLAGGSAASGLVYAPNAPYQFSGGADWYGSVIGAQMLDMGGTSLHYDRQLDKSAFTVGNWMLDSFTWKKY
jgi:Tfp pilus assembly protein PilX